MLEVGSEGLGGSDPVCDPGDGVMTEEAALSRLIASVERRSFAPVREDDVGPVWENENGALIRLKPLLKDDS